MTNRTNQRAGKMFEQISKVVDFRDKTVVDLGCGFGDLILAAAKSGAKAVVGIDSDKGNLATCTSKVLRHAPKDAKASFYALNLDVEDNLVALGEFDIAFCTSVLPYLYHREELLTYMSRHCITSIIEMQYFGDGPGPVEIMNDDDMKEWLSKFWVSVTKIGETHTGRNPAYRSLWMCVNAT